MNVTHSSLNEFIDTLESLWNQARAGPFRLAGNTLHKRRSFPALRSIVWLKCSIWSYESVQPSYIANDGITKPRGGSQLKICGLKGEDNISSSLWIAEKETKCGMEAALNG